MKLRMARFGDVFQDVSSLLATGGGRCQDALREAAAFRALRAGQGGCIRPGWELPSCAANGSHNILLNCLN